jgi:hypothetical protein
MTTTDNFLAFNNTKSFGRKRPAEISPTMDGAEALALAGIDWTVESRPLSELLDVPGANEVFISQRSDNDGIVGVNGKKYNVIQNDVLAEIGDAIRQVRPDAKYVSGGDKGNGKTVFLMLELSDPFTFGDNADPIYRNILLKKGHDGGAVNPMASMFRPSCMNQWGALMRTSVTMAKVPHTASHEQRLRFAIQTVQAAVSTFDEWDTALIELLNTPVRAGDVFKQIVGDRPEKGRALTEWENRLDNLWAEYSQDFNSNLIGTAAGVFMAAQGVDEHRGRGANKREQQQIGRLLTGAYPTAARALELVSAR